MESRNWQYDVALSYAGEDRTEARELAKLIQTAGYSVFYDEFEVLWGKDLSIVLNDIYEKQSRFCIMLVSENYIKKPWTNIERKAALARAMHQDTEYLLPIRLDDTDLPGPDKLTAYMDLRQFSMQEIFESLKRILGPPPQAVERFVDHRSSDIIIRMYPRNLLSIVIQKDSVKSPCFNMDCHLINESEKPGHIQWLEAKVTPAGKRDIQFVWNIFYQYKPGSLVMEKIDEVSRLRLDPQESRFVGVQFVGPKLAWNLQWPAGEYVFDISGWINREPRAEEPDLRTRFRVQITPWQYHNLNRWVDAPDAMWVQLNDPDDAVAIPVSIDKTSLIVG